MTAGSFDVLKASRIQRARGVPSAMIAAMLSVLPWWTRREPPATAKLVPHLRRRDAWRGYVPTEDIRVMAQRLGPCVHGVGKRALRRRRHLDNRHTGSGGEGQPRSTLQPGL